MKLLFFITAFVIFRDGGMFHKEVGLRIALGKLEASDKTPPPGIDFLPAKLEEAVRMSKSWRRNTSAKADGSKEYKESFFCRAKEYLRKALTDHLLTVGYDQVSRCYA